MSPRKKYDDKTEQMLESIRSSGSGFKLRLDRKTTITLKTEDELHKWLELYPKAQIIS